MVVVFFMNKDTFIKIIFSDASPSRHDFDGWHYDNLDDDLKAVVDRWLVPHGVTAKQCAEHYSFRHLVNAATYQNMESIGTDRFIAV